MYKGIIVFLTNGANMIPQTLRAVIAILEADQSISAQDRTFILRACENPTVVFLPENTTKITPSEAASILSCHRKTLFRYAKKGILHPIYHNARKVRFDKYEVVRLATKGVRSH